MTAGLLRVALTGGVATGKSYCLTRFDGLGSPTIDADVLARQAVAPGTGGFAAVISRFGAAIQKRDGGLDREALGRLVFSDPAARRDLEAIIHPAVYETINRWFDNLNQSEGTVRVAIADIPLLFESGHERDFHKVIVAACRPDQQLERLMERGGLTEEDAQRRIDSQMPIDEKTKLADYVIDTSGSEAETNFQVAAIWEKLNVNR